MSLKLADYQNIAAKLKSGVAYPIRDMIECHRQEFNYEGEVVAKERPRSGRGGKFYTPEKTRKFEAAVKKWGKERMTKVLYPISVDLVVYDKTDDPLLDLLGRHDVYYDMHNDLDNIFKAVMDGLNGVLFKDDKQIVKMNVERMWSLQPGFVLTVQRAGLSKVEFEQLRKHLHVRSE